MPEANTPAKLRLFVAIHVPGEIRARIQQAQDTLRHTVPRGPIRWAVQEQFHLTIKFLGAVEADRASSLIQALECACRGMPPLELRAASIGFFPNARRPRVVWAGVRELRNALPDLHTAVENASAPFTNEEPDTRFSGHITLARIKVFSRREAEALTRSADKLSALEFGDWVAQEIHLMRSELGPQGARHTILAPIPFHVGRV